MSSLVVRSSISGYLSMYTTTPFYNTINEQQEPVDPSWFTVSYESDYVETLTFCGQQTEHGTITISAFSESGNGYYDLISIVEDLMLYIHTYKDQAGHIELEKSHVINDAGWLDADRWYGLTAEIEYSYTL